MNRRDFLRKSIIAGGLLTVGQFPFQALASERTHRLVILHTNDVHSRLDPFPMDGSKLQGLGGISRRAAIVNQIRAKNEHVLLLDAGDIFQGTPYFNLFDGEPEFRTMSMLKYDAATMGNHDFDNGLDGFFKQLPQANFPFITSNYNFDDTLLKDKTLPYKITQKGAIKIGIIGLGIHLNGLVPAKNFGKTIYLDPVKTANETAAFLKEKKHCDLIICLSHLGYEYPTKQVSDQVVAQHSKYIDIIIGGHTHTFLDKPTLTSNEVGKNVIVNQVGWAGVYLGQIILDFDGSKNYKLANTPNVILSK